jgi:hypothetical protein
MQNEENVHHDLFSKAIHVLHLNISNFLVAKAQALSDLNASTSEVLSRKKRKRAPKRSS